MIAPQPSASDSLKPLLCMVLVSLALAGCEGAERGSGEAGLAESRAAPAPPSEAREESPQSTGIRFADVTAGSGVDFVHAGVRDGTDKLPDYVVGGFALLDYDGDDLLDIYFPNSGPHLPGCPSEKPTNRLFRNLGEWRFVDVTDIAGVGDCGHGLGALAGDFNNDGHEDLYVSNFGPNVFYLNNGDGTFSEQQRTAGVDDGDRLGAGICGLDFDVDGNLDLYVANYGQIDPHEIPSRTHRGVGIFGPLDYRPEVDALYRNAGDGTFEDASESSGIGRVAGHGMGVVSFDMDEDGFPDIFVCNDSYANFLFHNLGDGRFKEIALLAGVAYDAAGARQGNMGVDCGDFDGDGRQDLISTNFQDETPVLYRNLGDSYFRDNSYKSGLGPIARREVTWGVSTEDLDNDSWLDLFVASGHLTPLVTKQEDTQSFALPNFVIRNRGRGEFTDVTEDAGDVSRSLASTRGAACADLDNDGRVDGVLFNLLEPATLLRNTTEPRHHWLQLRLRGVLANRDGVGARVVVEAGDLRLVREVHCGRGYQSHHGMVLHFGLGSEASVERVTVHWPGGPAEVFDDLPSDQRVVLIQGRGGKAPLP